MGRLQYGKNDSEAYTEEQTRAILEGVGQSIHSETVHDFLCYCPYHSNRDSPSLSVSKSSGQFICFNPSCNESGQLIYLVMHVGKMQIFEALRFVTSIKSDSISRVDITVSEILEDKPDFIEYDQELIDSLHNTARSSSEAVKYFQSRGISKESFLYFKLGFSKIKQMITIPVYSDAGIPVGIIGRSITEKRFENSVGLPSAKAFFNLNNAKTHSSSVIVVEGAIDAIRVHQAGFPNVVATISGHVSPYKMELLNRYFNKVVIMTDRDRIQYRDNCRKCKGMCRGHSPGRELGMSIAEKFDRSVDWATYSDSQIYPDGVKDAGDMTDDQIRQCIRNAMNNVEYQMNFVV